MHYLYVYMLYYKLDKLRSFLLLLFVSLPWIIMYVQFHISYMANKRYNYNSPVTPSSITTFDLPV